MLELGDGKYCIMITIRWTIYDMLIWLMCVMIELGSIYRGISTFRNSISISIST